jgi:hypothetical protein
MRTLPEIQAGFAAALLADDPAAVAGEIAADGLAPEARLAVYRNHVLRSLTDALLATFPVVGRLVGEGFFRYAADRYVRAEPPVGPCLVEYGASFGDFLATFPPCAPHPYLGDVARLEWAMNAAIHAPEARPLAPAALAGVAAEAVPRLVFTVDPSATWLESPWPVDRIWRANQPDGDPGAVGPLDAGGVALEIRRHDDRAGLRAIAAAECAFRAALGRGARLEEAAAAALARDGDFDLTGAVGALFAEALLTGFTLAPERGEAP